MRSESGRFATSRGEWASGRVGRRRLLHGLSRDFDEFHAGRRFGYWLPVFLESFDVKLDRAVNELHNGGPRLGDRHAAGKIGDVRAEAFGAFLVNDVPRIALTFLSG